MTTPFSSFTFGNVDGCMWKRQRWSDLSALVWPWSLWDPGMGLRWGGRRLSSFHLVLVAQRKHISRPGSNGHPAENKATLAWDTWYWLSGECFSEAEISFFFFGPYFRRAPVQMVDPPEQHMHRRRGPMFWGMHLSFNTRARCFKVKVLWGLMKQCGHVVFIEMLSCQNSWSKDPHFLTCEIMPVSQTHPQP